MNKEQKKIPSEKKGKRIIVERKKELSEENNPEMEAEIQKVLGYASEYIKRKNYKEAENIYRKILTSSQNHPETLLRYASLCKSLSRLNDAEALLRRVITTSTPDHTIYNLFATILGNQNKTKEAIEYLKKSIELKPDFIDAYINLGSIYFRLNKLKKAELVYKQASDINPNHVLLLNNMATLHKRYKNYDKAEELYNKALEINPASAEVLSNLGDIYGHRMQLNKAEEVLLKAYEISPQIPEISANLSILYKKQSKYEEALSYAKVAHDIDTNNIAFKALYADILYVNKNVIYAIKLYEEVLSKNPGNVKILSMLGTCYRVIQDNRKSIEYFRKILDYIPNDENAIINISKFCTNEKPEISTEEAIELLENTLKKNPDSYRIKHLLASLEKEKIDRCTKEYVEDEFNRFAESFDTVLQQSLGYKIPDILYETIKPHMEENTEILDLGCGTGLSAIPFRPLNPTVTGIDLSENMLAKAESRGIYKKLIHGDITEEIDNIDQIFDLIISTDTLIYIGKLDNLFEKIYSKLKNNGLFAFSTEANNQEEQYVISPSGRFKHSHTYIKDLSQKNNFKIIESKEVVIRTEGSEQVKGFIYILKK